MQASAGWRTKDGGNTIMATNPYLEVTYLLQ